MKWNPSPKTNSRRPGAAKPSSPIKPVAQRTGSSKAIAPKAHAPKTGAKSAPSKPSAQARPAPARPRAAPGKFIPKVVLDDDRRVYGIHAVLASLTHMAERAKKLYFIEKNERIEPILKLAKNAGITIEQSAKQIFDVNYGTDIAHQGVMLVTEPYPYVDLDEELKHTKLAVVLDSIEDPRNLGRSARSAFALGAQLLIIPTNRAACVTASAEKAAVGTLARMKVAQVTNLNQAMAKLKKAGMWVVGSAGEATTELWACDFQRATAIVIGSEESGLRKLVRENCDELVRIPMCTPDMSLNAADALTIMLYEVARQRAHTKQ